MAVCASVHQPPLRALDAWRAASPSPVSDPPPVFIPLRRCHSGRFWGVLSWLTRWAWLVHILSCMPAHQAGPRRQNETTHHPSPPRRIIRAALPLIYLPSRLCSNASDWTDSPAIVKVLWISLRIDSPFNTQIEFRCSPRRRFERGNHWLSCHGI